MAPEASSQSGTLAAAHCPHIVFRDVLGAKAVAGLLDYVAAREADFKPAVVRNRETGQRRVDYDLRSSVAIADLGSYAAPFRAFIDKIIGPAVTQFGIAETALEPKEFAINAYRDGCRFGAHIDTDERLATVRVLSCIYYFAVTPRRFSGGELRLFGFPTLSGGKAGASLPFIDVVPETDTMVVFPSWLRHEVLPVHVPSRAWLDGRFTLNCWLYRATPAAEQRPRQS